MKVLIVLTSIIFLLLPVYSSVFSLSCSGFSFKSIDTTFNFRYNKLSFSYKGFSYGDITRRGGLRTFLEPHEYSDLRVRAMPFRKYNSKSGVIFTFSDFDIFLTLEERVGLGFSFERNAFAFFYGYFGKGRESVELQQNFMNVTSSSLMLFGMSYEHSLFSLMALGSADDNVNYSGLMGVKFGYEGYSLEARYGNTLALKERDDYEILSIKANISKENLNCIWKVSFGNKPVYSYEYQNKEYEKLVFLSIGSIDIISRGSYIFSRNGTAKYKDSITVKSEYISIGYDSADGIKSTIYFADNSIAFSRDSVEVKIQLTSKNDNYRLMLGFSNEKIVDLELTFQF